MIPNTNSSRPRWVMGIGLILLLAVCVFPIWQITLEAAQFPGGLRLNIWVDRFSGDEGGGDIIKNINILNHYIGMQYIEPDSIAELKYFPIVIWVMFGLGLITLSINRLWGYLTWGSILGILCLLGVYDFYLWLYDYGHNLDPSAPIKIEGMSYMPPLFGEKDLLNFYVKSYPRLGTLGVGLSLLLAFVAAWLAYRGGRKIEPT